MIEQRYTKVPYSKKHDNCGLGFLGRDGSSAYLASQHYKGSGLEKDLAEGWLVKFSWESQQEIVIILEREKK